MFEEFSARILKSDFNFSRDGSVVVLFTHLAVFLLISPAFSLRPSRQLLSPAPGVSASVPGAQFPGNIHLPVLRAIEDSFQPATLANFVGNRCDGRRNAIVKFGLTDGVEQRTQRNQSEFFMVDRQLRLRAIALALRPQKGGKDMSNNHATIKATTGFRSMKSDAVFSTSQAIYNALNGNANIPAPPAPFDLPTLLAANQALSAANSAALDGSKKTVAQRNQCKEVVVKILDQLAKYLQAVCKDDMTIFLSSGFKAQSSTKTKLATASESIRSVKLGPNSSQVLVKVLTVRGAGSYELRWAPVPAGGVPSQWTNQPIMNVRSATVVTGLTPGTNYAFQARAVIQSGYTDWSASVTQIAT